jgi:glycosyltransferase involved in cell wall biosynthesis
MKIAMVSEHASPLACLGGADGGGQNVHVDALARTLAAAGHEVVVHTRRDDPDLARDVRLAPGVEVHHVDAGPAKPLPKDSLLRWMPMFAQGLIARWALDSPDVVHAHFWMSALAAMDAAEPFDVPVAVTFHALGATKRREQGAADTSPGERVERERRIAQSVQQVIATSAAEVEELAAMRVRLSRVRVVPCGVDVERFTPDGPPAHLPRRAPHRLLSLGRLVPRKGVDDVIRALASVPDAELVVAGGPGADALDDDPELLRLRAVADSVGVAGRVRFLGAVARPDVPALIRSADLVVCVPWYEPFGIVPLEAMACGVPVVGSAVGGLLDTVEPGVTGCLVPARQPAALAAAVRALLADGDARRRMAAAGLTRVRKRFTWQQVAAEHERCYRAMLAAPTGRQLAASGHSGPGEVTP